MLKIENFETFGWVHAIRGMRNPMNSWGKSDSYICRIRREVERPECSCCEARHAGRCANGYIIDRNDYNLMTSLCDAGTDHRKFMRMITVYADITAPLYWWKEFDTYKVGTVANSCSTMHKIADKKFNLDDFSHEHLRGTAIALENGSDVNSMSLLNTICKCLNHYRDLYLKTNDKGYWWQMIQLLPSSYNQKRTVMLNYEVLANAYKSRRVHKLDEWCVFCDWVKELPYSELITGCEKE
jgi:hypothetical protein